jgi:hemerythrin-like domain-containing protein
MTTILSSRREALMLAGASGALLLTPAGAHADEDADVTANEDLMREHGVLRRALLVYREAARRADTAPDTIPQAALGRTARLFRDFGEDYHEKKLEEAYIFPAVRKVSASLRALADTLEAQHARGRAITDYVLDIAARAKFPAGEAREFAKAMTEMDWMYQNHAAREDTIVFPAWKAAVGAKAYDEFGDTFEDIEKATFGHDGFEDAVKTIAGVEAEFGLSDLAAMTAPPPPKI